MQLSQSSSNYKKNRRLIYGNQPYTGIVIPTKVGIQMGYMFCETFRIFYHFPHEYYWIPDRVGNDIPHYLELPTPSAIIQTKFHLDAQFTPKILRIILSQVE